MTSSKQNRARLAEEHTYSRITGGAGFIGNLGGDDTVASLVQFIDGSPFKPGYKCYRIRSVEGVDDYAAIVELRPGFRPNRGREARRTA